jgi:hypothetical protein
MLSCTRHSPSWSRSVQASISAWLEGGALLESPEALAAGSGTFTVPSAWPRTRIRRSRAFICMYQGAQLALPFKRSPSGKGLMLTIEVDMMTTTTAKE